MPVPATPASWRAPADAAQLELLKRAVRLAKREGASAVRMTRAGSIVIELQACLASANEFESYNSSQKLQLLPFHFASYDTKASKMAFFDPKRKDDFVSPRDSRIASTHPAR